MEWKWRQGLNSYFIISTSRYYIIMASDIAGLIRNLSYVSLRRSVSSRIDQFKNCKIGNMIEMNRRNYFITSKILIL